MGKNCMRGWEKEKFQNKKNRAEKWKETKVNLPTTLVSIGTGKTNPISAPPIQDGTLVGFCIAEVVGSPNCLGTAK
jgi:hypothetical protein